ncbi:MAG: hypothetical protein Q8J69_08535 [Sphingobacteriaceae bacterium]|nr:hypothetical protein [Sphingobacteriaceae bacterium]
MNNLHPKLNWEAFQKARARRKRRRLLWWFFWLPTTACIAGLLVFQLSGPSNEANKKAAKATTEALSEKAPAAGSTNAGTASGTPEKASAALNIAEQSLGKSEIAAISPEMKSAKREKATTAIAEGGSASQKAVAAATPKEAGQVTANPSLAVVTDKPSSKAVFASVENTPATVQAQGAAELAEPIEKMKPLKLRALMRKPLALPGTLVLLPAAELFDASTPVKRERMPSKFPIWVQLAWSPWHAAEFTTPAGLAANELNHRALNSAQLSLQLQLRTFNQFSLRLEPQFINQRFQTQFIGELPVAVYAPGSIIGYLQTIKGYEPIVSDSIFGNNEINLRQNGVQREFSLPVTLEYAFFKKGDFQLATAASLGLHYRARYQGVWFDGVQLVSLNTTPARLGMLATGSFSMQYQPGRIGYYCSWATTYRSTVRADQPALRNQVWIGMRLSISDF